MPKSGKVTCKYCPSSDPNWRVFVEIQTYSYVCCQGWLVFPVAGVSQRYWRGKTGMWDLF